MNLKLSFCTKLNHLKIALLILHQKKPTGNQEHIITLLLDNIFLKDQLRQKDKFIDSFINQFSQQNNYLFQKINTNNQLETNLESVKSKDYVKSKETEKIITTANNNKMEDTGEGKREKDSETNICNNKSSEQDISHEVELFNASNSQENIVNNDIEIEKDVTLQKQEISPEKHSTQSSTEKHINQDARVNNSTRSLQDTITLQDLYRIQ